MAVSTSRRARSGQFRAEQLFLNFEEPAQEAPPLDRAALIAEARECLVAHDEAAAAGNDRARPLARRIEEIATILNGGTDFGSAVEGGGLHVLTAALAAKIGDIPLRGQAGCFALTVRDCRFLVCFDRLLCCWFSVHALDLDKPFISETGYRSFTNAAASDWLLDPAAFAARAIEAHIATESAPTKGRKTARDPFRPIDPTHRRHTEQAVSFLNL